LATNKRIFSLPGNFIDCGVIALIVLCALGFLTARSGHAGVNKIIEGTHKVAIEVYISSLKTRDVDLFKVGEKSAITIRNQPVEPPMTIVAIKSLPKEIAFLANDGKKAIVLPDATNPTAHDFYVTLTDEADQTKDGYVIRGNKIKIGNQVELEGFKYRAQGVVVEIKAIP
jgi:hypothetical protein